MTDLASLLDRYDMLTRYTEWAKANEMPFVMGEARAERVRVFAAMVREASKRPNSPDVDVAALPNRVRPRFGEAEAANLESMTEIQVSVAEATKEKA